MPEQPATKEYRVQVHGTAVETYIVAARSPQEAWDTWFAGTLVHSEVDDCEPVAVELVDA